MDSKYTSITISKDLSKRIRLMALRKEMRTQKFLEFLCDFLEGKEDTILFNELEEDLKEINKKK